MNNPERLEQPKNDAKEVVTFHNREKNELEDVTKNTKSKTIRPTKNHLLGLWRTKIKPKIPWKSIWDPTKNIFFSTMRLLWQVHTPKSKINWLQRWINELHWFQGKEPYDEVWNM
jgi:hypothetical protein